MSPDDFLDLPRLSSVALSPCGTWLAAAVSRLDVARARFLSDLWRVPTDGSPPTRLLSGDHRDRAPQIDADGGLLFLSSRPLPGAPAEEADRPPTQVWRLAPDADAPQPVSQEPLGVSSFAVADGGRVVVLAPTLPGVAHDNQRALAEDRKKNGPSVRHYRTLEVRHWDRWRGPAVAQLVLLHGGERTVLLAGHEDDPLHEATLHAAGRFVVVTVRRPPTSADGLHDGDLWRFDLEAGTHTVLTAGLRSVLSSPCAHRDGHVACTVHRREDARLGPERLCLFAADAASPRILLADWDRWPTPVAWDGEEILITTQDHSDTALFRLDPAPAHPAALRLTGAGTVAQVSVSAGLIAAVHHDLLTPPHPILLRPGADTVQVLSLGASSLPSLDVVLVEAWVTADDGARVQGHILRPREASLTPRPALLWIHGGPVGQWGNGWHWRWCAALFAARGWVVAMPNPRGSTGFGQDFVEGIWGNRWGDQCFRDVMAWADALEARDDVDPQRMAAMGGSFGGYMVNWLGGSTPRFAALVSHAGIFDHRSFYGVTDAPRWWRHQLGLSPHHDPEAAERYAPCSRVSRWTSPVLILHGEKDYRCPVDQGLALFTALQDQGTPAELIIFPDEGHWIEKPRNIVAWYSAVWTFLEERLGPPQS